MASKVSKIPDLEAASNAEYIHLSSVPQTLLESYEQPTIFEDIT
jgi:hypothetical protein